MTRESLASIEARIRALLAKTTENGCTEAEAMAAMQKAQDLLEKYQIELGEEELTKEGTCREFVHPKDMVETYVVNGLGVLIGEYAEVQVYRSPTKFRQRIIPVAIVGLKSDVMFATFLINTLVAFGMQGAHCYRRDQQMSFLSGYVVRINQRLKMLISERRRNQAAGRNALVPVDKKALIQAELDRLQINLPKKGRNLKAYANDHGAYQAGASHANKATFERPLGNTHQAHAARLGR